MMKQISWLFLFLITIFILSGCASERQTIQPTQKAHLPSSTNLQVVNTVAPTSTATLANTVPPSPTATQTSLSTLRPEFVKETMQPLLQDPMNCATPCFLGIAPGKTSLDTVRAFFNPLGFMHREGTDLNSGRDFFSIGYEDFIGRNSHVTLYIFNNLVENIYILPEIIKQKEGSPRDWIAYSQETIIKKFGQPSRVDFYLAWTGDEGSEIIMNMYFYSSNLIVQYTGENMLDKSNHSPQLCPLTDSFDYVRLWLGPNPPNSPLAGVPLEQATSLTMDQFTQLMLGDPQNACFIINEDGFN
jgi:hypothetical protein